LISSSTLGTPIWSEVYPNSYSLYYDKNYSLYNNWYSNIRYLIASNLDSNTMGPSIIYYSLPSMAQKNIMSDVISLMLIETICSYKLIIDTTRYDSRGQAGTGTNIQVYNISSTELYSIIYSYSTG
jgi:hypothetical protein